MWIWLDARREGEGRRGCVLKGDALISVLDGELVEERVKVGERRTGV